MKTPTLFMQYLSAGLLTTTLCVSGAYGQSTAALNNTLQEGTSPWVYEDSQVRPLDEINQPDEAEAYPWLSSDGLRLYFIKGGSPDQLYYTERQSTDGRFSEPRSLELQVSDNDHLSPWLTSDELNIYFVVRQFSGSTTTTLFHASRSSVSESFSEPKAIKLEGDLTGFVSGPSLTADLSRLFLYNDNHESEQQVLIFERTAENTYILTDTLPTVDGYSTHPGSLSKDGKYYFCSMRDENEIDYLYALPVQGKSFGTPVKVEMPCAGNGCVYVQPNMSGGEEFLIFIRSDQHAWNNNDMYIATRKSLKLPPMVEVPIEVIPEIHTLHITPDPELTISTPVEFIAPNPEPVVLVEPAVKQAELPAPSADASSVKIYPNPTSDRVTISYQLPAATQYAKLELISPQGQIIYTTRLNNEQGQLDLNLGTFSPGLYICNIYTESGLFSTERVLVVTR